MKNKKPNLLFIMADQFRYDCIGAHGNPAIQTPNLDSFAAESADVRRYYTNCPVCIPSRVTLFTGRYPHSHRIRENHTLPESGAEMHLFRVLKQEGYYIGYTGKNHLLRDEELFNFHYADIELSASYPEREKLFHHKYSGDEIECRRFERASSERMEKNGAYAGAGSHSFPEEATEPHIFTDSAIRFLNTRASSEDPFCLCVSLVQPHAPHVVPDSIRELYDKADIDVPDADVEALKAKANRYFVKYNAQRGGQASDEDKRNFIATYYAMVTAVDRQFGRLMETLKKLKLDDNTIVVFTSDHGEFLFENGMCKKDLVLTEALLHVPLIIRYPGMLTPRVLDDCYMMEETDVLPTLLDMLDVELPLGVQGKSALAYLRGDTDRHKAAVYAEICAPWQYNPYKTFEDMQKDWLERANRPVPLNVPGDFTKSIRTEKYRYVWYATGEEELYDLENDPRERVNIATEYRDVLLEHKLRLLEWVALSEDPLDPKLCARNQKRYDKWLFRKSGDGAEGGPTWVEQAAHLKP